MKEYPPDKAYEHDTLLFKKTDWLKVQVIIYAPANVYFKLKREGDTFKYIAQLKMNDDTRIIAHYQPDREFDWDNNGTTITTKVFDPDGNEKSSNPIHTDNAVPY